MNSTFPDSISTEDELDDVLTHPSPELCEIISRVTSPLVVLGAGGKMGPSLAVLAKRAAEQAGHKLKIIAVSRFSDESQRTWLETRGVQTHVANLLKRVEVEQLPDASHVIYLVGMKFGTSQRPDLTWAANTLVPSYVLERYPTSRIAAVSTGNVYPLVPVASGGSREDDPLTPLGEYANAAVARERMFDYFSRERGTPVCLLRLSYALDLRYGVIPDLAGKVWSEEPIPLETGHFNCLWQGEANERIVRALELCESPASAYNLTSSQILSVRETALRLGELLGKSPNLTGEETGTAFISNTEKLDRLWEKPRVNPETLIRWSAHWVRSGGRSLNKPTHFETRDGVY
ncbi:MAG TPA: NAD(P)-dependent oxidoreductase [Planctomycetaceae bacterium]|nr:NAD(P)-dependent oxidoreductase [Planctomycetaceae bacterium]